MPMCGNSSIDVNVAGDEVDIFPVSKYFISNGNSSQKVFMIDSISSFVAKNNNLPLIIIPLFQWKYVDYMCLLIISLAVNSFLS